VRKPGLVGWCIAVAGCGRIGFDSLGGTSDGSTAMPSCSSLASICGPAGTSPCCGSSLVPGGMFYRSYDVGTDNAHPDMSYPAMVSDFRLDTYEVTVGRFRQFANAGMATQTSPPPAGAGARPLNGMTSQGGWDASWNASLSADTAALLAALSCESTYDSWTDAPGANEALPMNCITWFEAFAFCVWDGGFLPTEAEWNYAATGGSEQRAYPWSQATSLVIDCSYANHYEAAMFCVSPVGAVNRVGSESPKGDGRYGQADLAGNVEEWTLDWYLNPYSNPCNDCADLTPSGIRGMRGGDFFNDDLMVRAASRNGGAPDSRYDVNGVRCARSP
jgi:sulfatase modifying factor 1